MVFTMVPRAVTSTRRYAQLIGVPRGYGYGATMGAWVLDYLSNWGGELGFVVHCNARYIGPAFVGDATFLTGRVTKKEENPRGETGIVTVDFEMKNQNGDADGKGSGRDQAAVEVVTSKLTSDECGTLTLTLSLARERRQRTESRISMRAGQAHATSLIRKAEMVKNIFHKEYS